MNAQFRQWCLPGGILTWRMQFHDTVGSTQDEVRAMGLAGAPQGQVVVARAQTSGRGRRGRPWYAPAGGGLWLSALLRPPLPPEATPLLTLAAAVALARSLEPLGLRPAIKWPNDILCQGRKLAGILAERVTPPGGDPFVVLGIGVNLQDPPGGFPPPLCETAISVASAGGRPASRPVLARAFLRELCLQIMRLVGGDAPAVLNELRLRSAVLGRGVRVEMGDLAFEGLAVDLTPSGALVILTADGVTLVVHAGEVTLRLAGEPA